MKSNNPVRILVVDDYEPWHDFVSKTFQQQVEFEIVGKATDGLQAIAHAQRLHPDLILLDIGLPVLNGIEAAKRIRKSTPEAKILFVSENRSLEVAQEALGTGAGGYVIKSDAEEELLPAVKAVLEGKRFITAALAGHFLVAATLSTTPTIVSGMLMLISGCR